MRFRTVALLALILLSAKVTHAQSFGVELFNNIMPASGAMGGASIASPQDVQSAIKGNPATMTQYHGTNFGFGGAWIEPTYNLTVDRPGIPLLFNIQPFTNAKSSSQGIAAGNIGVTQEICVAGTPVTVGLGLFAGAGAGVDFRHNTESNGTHPNIVSLDNY
jgi:long-chain fatty acid transport protein